MPSSARSKVLLCAVKTKRGGDYTVVGVHGRHETGIKVNGFHVPAFERNISMTFDVYEIETLPQTKKSEASMIPQSWCLVVFVTGCSVPH